MYHVPGSTLVIRPPYDENEKPTSIDFNINEKLGGKWYRLTGIVMVRVLLFKTIHYTTIAFVPEKEQWYNFNDRKVRPVDPPRSGNLPLIVFLHFRVRKLQEE